MTESLTISQTGERHRISAMESGREKGYLIFEPKREEPNTAYIIHIRVPNEDDRSSGIGRQLMTSAFKNMLNLGYTSIALEVDEANLNAYSWYTRLGFTISERYQGLGDHFMLAMTKSLIANHKT